MVWSMAGLYLLAVGRERWWWQQRRRWEKPWEVWPRQVEAPPPPIGRGPASTTPGEPLGLQAILGDLSQSDLITVISDQNDFLCQEQKEMDPNEKTGTAWVLRDGCELGIAPMIKPIAASLASTPCQAKSSTQVGSELQSL